MSLFEQANLVLTPNGYKAGKLYSIKPTSGAGDLDVVRATSATRVNVIGLIETVANNVPRLDYPPLGGCPSILVEPQRTNLVFPSDVATTQTRTVTAVAHTLSFYGTGTVDLSGVAIATLSGTGANNRVTLTFTPTAGSLILTVTGSVLDWQLEAGAYATSYIPTVASTVTRNADVISKTGISDLINSPEGALFVEMSALSNDGSLRNITLNDGTINNEIRLFYSSISNTITYRILVGGTIIVNSINSVTTTTLFNKIAIKWKQNDFKMFVNGSIVSGSVTTGNSFSANTLNRLNFSRANSNEPFAGKIKSLQVYPTALSDAQLESLTTL
jgi:hypothetical protein